MECEQGHRITATIYRLYPNATSEKRMLATLEHCRSLYNRLLADCKATAARCTTVCSLTARRTR